ncbi:MAG: hypothetical protein Sylvanvirus5_26 [Sylvanvirus sp.]|uniref:Lipoxygenase domain-containing protein n=1 Tax=Sylvanvirus sp. TaxID=2487774 RepID=A0A3G5AHN6_9VIRU|nr:MAG: hypothetical protein Sylvanvirus5_26 [Sylvanvirus sp.]
MEKKCEKTLPNAHHQVLRNRVAGAAARIVARTCQTQRITSQAIPPCNPCGNVAIPHVAVAVATSPLQSNSNNNINIEPQNCSSVTFTTTSGSMLAEHIQFKKDSTRKTNTLNDNSDWKTFQISCLRLITCTNKTLKMEDVSFPCPTQSDCNYPLSNLFDDNSGTFMHTCGNNDIHLVDIRLQCPVELSSVEILNRQACEDRLNGVTVTVHSVDGRLIKQFTLTGQKDWQKFQFRSPIPNVISKYEYPQSDNEDEEDSKEVSSPSPNNDEDDGNMSDNENLPQHQPQNAGANNPPFDPYFELIPWTLSPPLVTPLSQKLPKHQKISANPNCLLPQGHNFSLGDLFHTGLALYKGTLLSSKSQAEVSIDEYYNETWKKQTTFIKFGPSVVGEEKLDGVYTWKSDRRFGDQRLMGVNPIVIRRLRSDGPLPSDWLLTPSDSLVISSLGVRLPGKSFANARQEGLIFYVDYRHLATFNLESGRNGIVTPYPLCVFVYQKSQRALWPIFFQFDRSSPLGSCLGSIIIHYSQVSQYKRSWQYAKLCFQAADFTVHQLYSHLTKCHLVMEIVCVLTYRWLPKHHVVFNILKHHFDRTLAINYGARIELIPNVLADICGTNAQGIYNLIGHFFSTYDFQGEYLPNELTSRGFQSNIQDLTNDTPSYYYARDALSLWAIIYSFVQSRLKNIYSTDASVVSDTILQNWAAKLHEELPIFRTAGNVDTHKGFPMRFQSLKEITDAVSHCIFTAVGQHGAVNFLQEYFMAFIPNMPAAIHPATLRHSAIDLTINSMSQLEFQSIDKQFFVKSLPRHGSGFLQKVIVEILADTTQTKSFLDWATTKRDKHSKCSAACFKLKLYTTIVSDLLERDKTIHDRNKRPAAKKLARKYDMLLAGTNSKGFWGNSALKSSVSI